MFHRAESLTCVGDLSGWDTSSATAMSSMFDSATSLASLNLTGWDTSNVTVMRDMFRHTHSLVSIEGIGDWDVSNVTNMFAMFQSTRSLVSLDLSGWNNSNVTNMAEMFSASAVRQLSLGENFVFEPIANLFAVPSNATYTGRWRNLGTGSNPPWSFSLTSRELMETFNGATMADTWVWETHIRDYYNITYIYVDFMQPSTQEFLQGNLSLTELVHILGNTPSLLNRTYEIGTFQQVLRELPIPALSGWELLYSYIIFENPAMGISGHISQLPIGFDVNNVSGNITIIVLFI